MTTHKRARNWHIKQWAHADAVQMVDTYLQRATRNSENSDLLFFWSAVNHTHGCPDTWQVFYWIQSSVESFEVKFFSIIFDIFLPFLSPVFLKVAWTPPELNKSLLS